MSEITNQPVLLLDYEAYVALTYKLENPPRAITLQNNTSDYFLAIPFSDEAAGLLETYYNPEKDFLVDPLKYAQHEKYVLDSWLAEDWVYEEMLSKSTGRQ